MPKTNPTGYAGAMGSLSRAENLARLRDLATWDVVVIGGGATGLGAAVELVLDRLRAFLRAET